MLQLVFFTLFTSGFIESQGRKVFCESSELKISYSFCDSVAHVFLVTIVPCSFSQRNWKGTVFWIPRSDIIFMKVRIELWYNTAKVLDSKHIVCHGFDDDFSFCGTLKGETVNTTFHMSGVRTTFLKMIESLCYKTFHMKSQTMVEEE
ncbi:lymphocyte antigen 96 isoform X2 [Pelodiscus sinensis]|uniref:lymphocyte antigen 96 isoform X2 n=1 Tax=Pelodiscus sinensis TaxID=13735 RepID=UPI003F6B7067